METLFQVVPDSVRFAPVPCAGVALNAVSENKASNSLWLGMAAGGALVLVTAFVIYYQHQENKADDPQP